MWNENLLSSLLFLLLWQHPLAVLEEKNRIIFSSESVFVRDSILHNTNAKIVENLPRDDNIS